MIRVDRRLATDNIDSSGFFVLRTPLLPFDDFTQWSEGLEARRQYELGGARAIKDAAWQRDVETLRARLLTLVERPDVRQALFVASPTLESSINHWASTPECKKGLQTERSLVRYFARMSGRATPFGLFAGGSTGTIADRVGSSFDGELLLESRKHYKTSSRLDSEYIGALSASLSTDPRLAAEVLYWPAPGLHKIGDSWHCISSTMDKSRISSRLVKIQSDRYLDAVIERAEVGATLADLAETVIPHAKRSDGTKAQAERYIAELLSAQVLVSSISPAVTGKPVLDDLIDALDALPSMQPVSLHLRDARTCLATLDHGGLGVPRHEYESIARGLDSLPTSADVGRLFQVDMTKPFLRGVLPSSVVDEVVGAVDFLCRVGANPPRESLRMRAFRQAFSSRYPAAWVPLSEALDEEAGIGFGRQAASDLLAAGAEPVTYDQREGNEPGLSPFHSVLLRKLIENTNNQTGELVLDAFDFASVIPEERYLPSGFSVVATIAASSMTAVRDGTFKICFRSGIGPSGAVLLGRFCHADPELERYIRQHIRDEEKNDPDAVYAEIVYQPLGRAGNIVARPILRDYEIICSGRSGAPPEKQLPLSDLLVTVDRDQVLLYSKRLGKRVIPRLTAAHGFNGPTCSSAYQFLGYLQYESKTNVPMFDWGPISGLPFLPRVRVGRVVLSEARWWISAEDTREITRGNRCECFFSVQDLRQRRNLPRFVLFIEKGNTLAVDLDNPLSVDAFLHVLKRAGQTTLLEMYPRPDELCVAGPEGRFQHEIVIPFVRRSQQPSRVDPFFLQSQRGQTGTVPAGLRTFPPGSDWLYWKIYGGPAVLDEILTTVLPPLVQKALADGTISSWFFIRYSHPHRHLRIRFHGIPGQLHQVLLPQINDLSGHLLSAAKSWKVEFDTYEREVERYGGIDGIFCAEQLFCADSQAVLAILQTVHLNPNANSRLHAATVGFDRLLHDCGFSVEEREAMIRQGRQRIDKEFLVDKNVRKRFSERFRLDRAPLELLFDTASGRLSSAMLAVRGALDARSASTAPVIRTLQMLLANGQLTRSIEDIALSFGHMYVNRLMQSHPRVYELAVYDYLARLYSERRARQALISS